MVEPAASDLIGSSRAPGTLAGMTLAQLGAEVVRVDPIGGVADYHRWPVTAAGDSADQSPQVAPAVGHDTAAVLADHLGLSGDAIAALAESGTVATGSTAR